MLNKSAPSLLHSAFLFLACVLIFYTPADAYIKEAKFERISLERGLSHASVYSVLQDRDGFMWLATGDGLNRYDGYGFKIFRHDPSDPGTIISGQLGEIFQDTRGIIWIGTWGGGLDRFDPDSNRFVHLDLPRPGRESISNDRVEDIEEDLEGNIWAGMEKNGLIRIDPITQEIKRYKNDPENPHSLVNDDVKVLLLDRQGSLWIGTNGGISVLTRGKNGEERFINYRHVRGDPGSLAGNGIRALCEDSEGKIWIGTRRDGISIFDPNPENGKFTHLSHIPGISGSVCENSIASLMCDSAGDIWIGTYESGLNRYRKEDGKIDLFQYESKNFYSLGHNRAEALCEDSSGNLWVGTLGGGVNRLDLKARNFRDYLHDPSEENSLPNPAVRAICRMGEEIVIGTEGGLTRYNPGLNSYIHLRSDPKDLNTISGDRIWSVAVDRKGVLWAGTYTDGLNEIEIRNGKTKINRYLHDPEDGQSLSYNRVQALFADSDGDIWAGTSEGLNLLKRDGNNLRFKRFFMPSGETENIYHGTCYIVSIIQDRNGMMWIGTRGGLIRLKKQTGEFSVFACDPENNASLGSNSVLTITESVRYPETLWIGTADGGLNRFDTRKQTFDRYDEKDGLPGNEVCGILEDRNGILWLSTNSGLSKFDPGRNNFRNYKGSSGIEGAGFIRNACFKSDSGEMFFGSISGMVSFIPETVTDNMRVPQIEITSFRKLGEEITLRKIGGVYEEIELSHDENFIHIEFASMDFTSVKENRFSYYLKGVDYDWVTPDSGRSVSYNHLRPGDYEFTVKGTNNDGVWNEDGSTLRIVIVPAFWQTLWFKALIFLFAAVLIFSVYQFRVITITRINKKLSALNESLNLEITNRISAEEALRKSELSYKTLFLNANDSIFLLNDGVFIKCNEKTPGLFGYPNESSIIGKHIDQFSAAVQPDGRDISQLGLLLESAVNGTPQRFNWTFVKAGGSVFDAEISLNRLELEMDIYVQAILRDITEQKKMRDRMAVTQKMESIGELAGGIAHDFNNILTAMNGYAEMALGGMETDSKAYKYVGNILKRGNQAVDLVQKLLGFSRQQIIAPAVMDVNHTISELNDMLVRLIGEDIELDYTLKDGIKRVQADPTQMEQIIINVIVNARDAVNLKTEKSFRKKIIISTDESEIDDNFMKTHSGSRAGRYVVISVSDNGVGINRKVQERIFEPFFTTKGFGKGTGLGLSTVYGIVKQNNGYINVMSEENKGTIVAIYWPVFEGGKGNGEGRVVEKTDIKGGSETILFVEDDEDVRDLSTTILKNLGYKVYSASNGEEALDLIESGNDDIDLLVTDVIMPKMGGKELAEAAKKRIPGMKVLFASGYTDDYIVHSGVLEEGVNFIQKPFSVQSLANKIREVLPG